MIGQSVLHYKIVEKLGEGGMGVVYKAQDTKLNRFVALKFLPSQVSGAEKDKERFLQEAQAAAALTHTNICTIHGIEEHEGRQFIVMEFVDGQMLEEKKASLTQKQAIEIGIQIAEGLAAAHEKGIIHRDIKPENIMISKDGRVQIMDFGLARLRGASRLTKDGSTVGTAGYMSPEQVQGQETDHRSDIFSLGVLLFEMFTGQAPFKGVHETAIAYEIVNVESPPMSSINPEISPELDDIVLSCLAKEPQDRYQSAAEIARVLRKLKKGTSRVRSGVSTVRSLSTSAQTPAPFLAALGILPRERWVWLGSMLILLCGLVVVASLHVSESPQERQTIRFLMQPPAPDATIGSLALSPDGKRLAYTATVEGGTLIWIRQLDQLESYRVAGTENATYPFWSPDGQYIAFFAGGKLKKVDISGGAPVVICDAPIGRGGSWSPTGEIIFAPNISSLIYKIHASGGKPTQVTVLDSSRGDFEHIWPFVLPDGEHFLYSSRRFDHDIHMISYASLTTGSTKQITQSYGNVFYSPPGYLVFLSDQVLMAQPFDAETGMLTDEPFQLGENPGFVPLTGQAAYSLSANGVLATGGGRVEARQYAWFDRQGSLLEIVTPPGNFFDIDLSPDGSRAVVQYDVGGDNSDIYVIDLVRKELTQFTFTPEVEDNPIWSSDGSMILFDRFAVSKPAVVYKKRSTGAGTEEPLPYDGRLSDWSNDGRYILFYAQGSGDITYADLNDGGKLTHYLATSATELYGHFSPNGKYVAYSSNESGIFEIYVQTFPEPGGKWRVSEGGGSQPEWRSDGKELFYIASDRTLMATQTSTNREFTYTAPKRLFRTQVDDFDAPNRYVVSNDGTRFLVNIPAGNSGGNPVTITVNWLEGRGGQ